VELRVVLQPDADGDDVERQLFSQPRALSVDRVDAVFSGDAPPAATGPETTDWLVALSASGGAHKITVTIDGDILEPSSATPAEHAGLINILADIHRHQPA
jgi:hypothetical protein